MHTLILTRNYPARTCGVGTTAARWRKRARRERGAAAIRAIAKTSWGYFEKPVIGGGHAWNG